MLHALHIIVLSENGVNIIVCYCLFFFYSYYSVLCSAPSLSYSQELDISLEEALSEAGGTLRMCDFEAALSILQAAHSDAIGAPKVCNETVLDSSYNC
jgi:hypothetical protein